MISYIHILYISFPPVPPAVHMGAVCDEKLRAAPSTRVIRRLLLFCFVFYTRQAGRFVLSSGLFEGNLCIFNDSGGGGGSGEQGERGIAPPSRPPQRP